MVPYRDEKNKNQQLYRKYRPRSTKEILGNKDVVKEIRCIHEAFRQGKPIPHSYLFHGPAGCSKTTCSRVLARGFTKMPWHDIAECNSADYGGIEQVREIGRLQMLAPWSKGRVFILDEAHRLTHAAQEALLKMLEEPSPRSYFILATTKPDDLTETIMQRCIPFKVCPLKNEHCYELIKRVCKGERKTLPKEVIDKIVAISHGVPRVILQNLERTFWRY